MNSQLVLQRFSKSLQSSSGIEESVDILSEAAVQLGFEGAASVFWPRSMESNIEVPQPALVLSGSNLPITSWQRNYIKTGMFKADFVYRACRDTTLPVVWSSENVPEIVVDIGYRASMTERIGIDELVKATGFSGGISIPIHGLAGVVGYVSFVSKLHLPALVKRREVYFDKLLGMAHRFYDSVADKLVFSASKSQRLTVRELECLTLLGLGKTLNEVAEIVGLSYSTIRFHLYNVQRKMGTNSRTHAIAKAASIGLLGRID